MQALKTNIILAALAMIESLINLYWSSASAFAICVSTVNNWLMKQQHAAMCCIFTKHFSMAQMFYHFIVIQVQLRPLAIGSLPEYCALSWLLNLGFLFTFYAFLGDFLLSILLLQYLLICICHLEFLKSSQPLFFFDLVFLFTAMHKPQLFKRYLHQSFGQSPGYALL